MFSEFDQEPIASASIAQVSQASSLAPLSLCLTIQVHRARLRDGTQVAVKVQKPAIQCQVALVLRGVLLIYM
jgi:predicted unusual protein kinase regulating ubiquinone biosynthesis (AarF/ABC1/UbiB family)